MKFINLPKQCPKCGGALGDPMPFRGDLIVHCWNRSPECLSAFIVEGEIEKVFAVKQLVKLENKK